MNIKDTIVLDCECYPNYFLIAFKRLNTGKVHKIECRGEETKLTARQCTTISTILTSEVTFGYNSNNFDIPIIMLALQGVTTKEIHELCESIITGRNKDKPAWMFMKDENIQLLEGMDHFDIMQVAPGVRLSLKLYGARLNTKTLQDLPIAPGTVLTDLEMDGISKYCENDLVVTIELFNKIRPALELRVLLSEEYSTNLLSKSDAQIAETVFRKKLNLPYAENTAPEYVMFKSSDCLKFQSPVLKQLLEEICAQKFNINKGGGVVLPDILQRKSIDIGTSSYRLGIGGLHSQEKGLTVVPAEGECLIEKDVSSHYPSIILGFGLYPEKIGEKFLDVYRKLYDARLQAKKLGQKDTSNSLKIVINGAFGKLGSIYSSLYSPDLLITVTLTGQLTLLMVIERLELAGISIVSANTDAFVALVPDHLMGTYQEICAQWEKELSLELDDTKYSGMYSIGVNSYFAITTEGEVKAKSQFSLGGINKNPHASICATAVMDLISTGKDIEQTILDCKDITQFLIVRTVNGGAVWNDQELGKVVRWYKSHSGKAITYKANGNKVPKSDDSTPLMILESGIPADLDYSWYYREAKDLLFNTGYSDL